MSTKYLKSLIIILVFISQVLPAHQLTKRSIIIDDIERTYGINQLNTKQEKIPLIVALHGGGSTWKKFAYKTTKSNLLNAAIESNALIIFPQGVNNHWNDGRKHLKSNINDVKFISQLIDISIKINKVDRKRVYITGFSNGGFMTIRLAIELSDKITAVAAVSAQLTKAISSMAIKNPVSFLLINGNKDPIIPFQGGEMKMFKFSKSKGSLHSTQQTLNYFIKANKCKQHYILRQIDKNKFDKTSVQIKTYKTCDNNHQVKLIQIQGGGHLWPGGMQYLPAVIIGKLSKEIDAGQEVIKFFMRN